MEVQLSAEREAQLAEYAQRRGQDPSEALDEIVADALEWERQDYQEAASRGFVVDMSRSKPDVRGQRPSS